jgi:hypothetical protein
MFFSKRISYSIDISIMKFLSIHYNLCILIALINSMWYYLQRIRPTIPTGDKPVLGSVAWSHAIFRFLNFFSKYILE